MKFPWRRDSLAEVAGWLVPITAIDEATLVRLAKDRSQTNPPKYLDVFERLRQLDTCGHTGKLWETLVANEYEAMVAVKLLPVKKSRAATSRVNATTEEPDLQNFCCLNSCWASDGRRSGRCVK